MKTLNKIEPVVFCLLIFLVLGSFSCDKKIDKEEVYYFPYAKKRQGNIKKGAYILENRIFDGYEGTYKVCFIKPVFYSKVTSVKMEIEGSNAVKKDVKLDSLSIKPVYCFGIEAKFVKSVVENKRYLFFSHPAFKVEIGFDNGSVLNEAIIIQTLSKENIEENYYFDWEKAIIQNEMTLKGIAFGSILSGNWAACGETHSTLTVKHKTWHKAGGEKIYDGEVILSRKHIEAGVGELCLTLYAFVVDKEIVEKRELSTNDKGRLIDKSIRFDTIINFNTQGDRGLMRVHDNNEIYPIAAPFDCDRLVGRPNIVPILYDKLTDGVIRHAVFFPTKSYEKRKARKER